jgi:hypothetical protein
MARQRSRRREEGREGERRENSVGGVGTAGMKRQRGAFGGRMFVGMGHVGADWGMGGREKRRLGSKTRGFREARKKWGILGQIGALGKCDAVMR